MGSAQTVPLRMMVPTVGYPIGLFVLIARAGRGVAKAMAHHFAQHGISRCPVRSVTVKVSTL